MQTYRAAAVATGLRKVRLSHGGTWKGVECHAGRCFGFSADGGVRTSREKKKPDQFLGRYIIYTLVN